MNRAKAKNDNISSPYECPVHHLPLVLETMQLSPMGRGCTGITTVEFFRCPYVRTIKNQPIIFPVLGSKNPITGEATIEQGKAWIDKDSRCRYMKPNKWQKYPIRKK